MIAFVRGTVLEKNEGEAVIMTAGGIGMRLLCSSSTLITIPPSGKECELYAHLNVREDAMELYGFATREEREMFWSLISVSGVGPKSALLMLGSMPLGDLRLAIMTGDVTALSRAQGVGKKTAQRISLELRDKLAKQAIDGGMSADEIIYVDSEAPAADAIGEAMQALKALGYTPQESAAALKAVKGKADAADELIKLALRHMAQQG